jgi:hypothetical protein
MSGATVPGGAVLAQHIANLENAFAALGAAAEAGVDEGDPVGPLLEHPTHLPVVEGVADADVHALAPRQLDGLPTVYANECQSRKQLWNRRTPSRFL